MMKNTDAKYESIVNMLRNSVPEPASAESIEREVLKRIQSGQKNRLKINNITDFLFGWIYIGWVRKSLVAASFVLVGFFIFQQNRILREMSSLRQQIIQSNRESAYDPSGILQKKLTIYRMSRLKTGTGIDSLPDSIIRKIIEEDPELRKMVESRIKKNLRGKFNL